jgi:uncharacterized membrane protein YqjE
MTQPDSRPGNGGSVAAGEAGATGHDHGGQDDLRGRSMGELLKMLSEETTTLVRKEIELAKAEMTQKGKEAGVGAGMFAAAAVVGLLALGTLTAFFVMLLDGAMPNWLAAFVVFVVYAAIAGVLASVGRKRVQRATPPMPEQTVDTVKEDVQWAKTRAKSAQR